MRALVVTNMYPSPARPALGSFVRDQVLRAAAHRRPRRRAARLRPRRRRAATRAPARDLRRRFAGERFDVVHAHFGLTAWPALAVEADKRLVTLHGNDLYHPRSRPITTAVLRPAWTSSARRRRASRPRSRAPAPSATIAILPCGIDVERFRPLDRRAAREQLGLDPDGPLRAVSLRPRPRRYKRVDRARELAPATDAELLTLGAVAPERRRRLWMNAANAVVCPSDWETFGLACIEALACDVPVLARPTGAHAEALRGIAGTLLRRVGPRRLARRARAAPRGPPIRASPGAARALDYSADALARTGRRARGAGCCRGGPAAAAILARRGAGRRRHAAPTPS